MANPRRISFSPSGNHHQLPISAAAGFHNQTSTQMSSLISFLKKPHAFPFLLSLFLFLTWVSLRFQRPSDSSRQREEWHPAKFHSSGSDQMANLLRFPAPLLPLLKINVAGCSTPFPLPLILPFQVGQQAVLQFIWARSDPVVLGATTGTTHVMRHLLFGELRQYPGWKMMRSKKAMLKL